jgi:hypothetical protein
MTTSLSKRIEGLSESLECGDGGVRGEFEAALAEVDALEAALEHIKVHDEHGQECRRPPQDCAADALDRLHHHLEGEGHAG